MAAHFRGIDSHTVITNLLSGGNSIVKEKEFFVK
jgi:hypothetical protein